MSGSKTKERSSGMDQWEVDRRAIEEAHALVVAGDWARVVPILEELHSRGIPEGTGMLGLLYSSGQGVPMNGPLAEQMLLTAASAGVGTAAHDLGTLYLGG